LEAVVPLVAYRGLLPKAAFANDDCNAARARRGGASMVRRIFRIPGGDNARWNMSDDAHTLARQRMVATIAAETIFACASIGKAALAERVLDAVGRVPRHDFVPVELQPFAYVNSPLPIGCGKTISQPFIVALMTDLLDVEADDRVLEIGTGLGYQAAVLAELTPNVYSVEIVEELAHAARERLRRRKHAKIRLKIGNGYYGWPEHAPYDKIIVTAAPDLIPPPLIEQLAPGGKMVIPAGLPGEQRLLLVEKDGAGTITTTDVLPVRFSELEGTDLPSSSVS
jgi:protein-L-isoaspartate(D-aspartate) O-methyltransferase